MKLTLNKQSLYFISGLGIGYIVGCWSSIILALVIITSIFLIFKDDISELYKRKRNLMRQLQGIKKAIPSSANEKHTKVLEAQISNEILSQIKAYCRWANIDDLETFIEKSSTLVFSKDREWINYSNYSPLLATACQIGVNDNELSKH